MQFEQPSISTASVNDARNGGSYKAFTDFITIDEIEAVIREYRLPEKVVFAMAVSPDIEKRRSVVRMAADLPFSAFEKAPPAPASAEVFPEDKPLGAIHGILNVSLIGIALLIIIAYWQLGGDAARYFGR